ncbi:hypothetical protein [Burkholderia sp. Ac-20379]|nr:hypothetical protein [Burkholderia sp. Ac-20379]
MNASLTAAQAAPLVQAAAPDATRLIVAGGGIGRAHVGTPGTIE